MKKILFAIFLLFDVLIVGLQIHGIYNKTTNSVSLNVKDNTCSSNISKYAVFEDTTLELFCPFTPIEWIYRTKPSQDWKYNFQTVESRYQNYTLEDIQNNSCVCCRSMLDFSLACLQLIIMTPPKLIPFYVTDFIVETYCDKSFEIECPYVGYPELNYTWVHWRTQTSLLKPYPETEVMIPEMEGQVHNRFLHFHKYTSSLSGNFKCVAENQYGIEGNTTLKNGSLIHKQPIFQLTAPQECLEYSPYFLGDLSQEYTAVIGGNVTMSCMLQFNCQYQEKCLKYIFWDESVFPPDRTLRINGTSCSTCIAYQNRTIINLEASDFDKTYSCLLTKQNDPNDVIHLNTTIKQASKNIQTFNPLPALLPTTTILIALTIITVTSVLLGVYYKRRITMFFYYRLAKEPPYVKGLQHDVFISFASLDREFVEEKIYNRIKNAGYKVIWYPDDFLAGDVILQKAKDSIWKSRKTIICLSDNFLASDYCGAEKEFCFQKAMETFKNFLIVVHLDDCKIPSDMKKLKIIKMKLNSLSNHLRAFSNIKYLLKAPIDYT